MENCFRLAVAILEFGFKASPFHIIIPSLYMVDMDSLELYDYNKP
jgi:hypothetical protein